MNPLTNDPTAFLDIARREVADHIREAAARAHVRAVRAHRRADRRARRRAGLPTPSVPTSPTTSLAKPAQ